MSLEKQFFEEIYADINSLNKTIQSSINEKKVTPLSLNDTRIATELFDTTLDSLNTTDTVIHLTNRHNSKIISDNLVSQLEAIKRHL